MRHETIVRVGSDIYVIAGKIGPGAIGIKALWDELKTILDSLNIHLDQIHKSAITVEIEGQDHRRRELYRGLSAAIRAFLHHPDPEKHAAATRLAIVLDRYGDVSKKTYDDESAAIDDLVKELYAPVNAPLVILLGVGEWVTLLSSANAAFVNLMVERYEEVNRHHDPMRVARVPLENVLQKIVRRVESIVELNGIDFTPELATFVQEYNAIASRYKHIMAQEEGRRKAHHADDDATDDDNDVVEEQ
jgi:hypothetical protein